MLVTSGDILNITLAIGFGILVIFLSVMLLYFILILRDVSKITDHVKDTAKRVNACVIQPIKFAEMFWKRLLPLTEFLEERIKEYLHNRRKKTRKE